ncbi:MAG: hypothetical protein CSA45_04365 [Gammaproteobacteria bacterium]|nr:MAG: hypothetical protein CSA45_04365 [Gammaproteobacteria bacterium]
MMRCKLGFALLLSWLLSNSYAQDSHQSLEACLDDNHSSGWHIIANENACYIQEYQRQLADIHQQMSSIYQQILSLPMHKNKQASGSIAQMHKDWQQYRDNKCRLFTALELPFRRVQQSYCQLETTKSYLAEQQKLLQELQQTLADDTELTK